MAQLMIPSANSSWAEALCRLQHNTLRYYPLTTTTALRPLMHVSTPTLKRIGTITTYLVLGVVGTAAVALGSLYILQPVQRVIYTLFYLHVGSSAATQAAILGSHILSNSSLIKS